MTANDPSAATRARGQIVVARALWYTKPGQGELRSERLPALRPGEARVRTLFSLISRGTERLVAHGEVPQSEWTTMRAPMQVGAFPFPVKYGYSATGVVTAGRQDLVGSTIFCLHPHQDHFLAPEATLLAVPGDVPARRAILAANMETALNAHWDAGTTPGDRILVVGAGIVGLLTAHLARRIAGADVVICDIDPGRGELAARLGIAIVTGPHTHNFEEIFPVLLAAQGDGRVNSAEELSKLVQKLIADPGTASQLGTRAKSASDCLRGALSATLAVAETLITHART